MRPRKDEMQGLAWDYVDDKFDGQNVFCKMCKTEGRDTMFKIKDGATSIVTTIYCEFNHKKKSKLGNYLCIFWFLGEKPM